MGEITNNNNKQDMFEVMDKAYKFASILAKSDLVPSHYRGKPENAFIAVQTAYRMNIDPMLIMQNSFVYQGKLSMYSSFLIGLANRSGILKNGIRYIIEGKGQDLKVTAYAYLKDTGDKIEYTISMMEAAADGWTRNSKYKTLPELMLRYKAAAMLVRTHLPEVQHGIHIVEDLEDAAASQGTQSKTDSLLDKMKQATADYEAAKETKEEPKQIENIQIDEEVTAGEIVENPVRYLPMLITDYQVDYNVVEKWLEKAGVETLSELSYDQATNCIQWIYEKHGTK